SGLTGSLNRTIPTGWAARSELAPSHESETQDVSPDDLRPGVARAGWSDRSPRSVRRDRRAPRADGLWRGPARVARPPSCRGCGAADLHRAREASGGVKPASHRLAARDRDERRQETSQISSAE